MFLSPDQIVQLTGKKRPKAQCAFLSREGYKFRTNGCGEPVLMEDEVRRKFGLPATIQSRTEARGAPDLNWRAMSDRGMVRGSGPTKNS